MKPLLVSSGEPAGIGPDLCVALADYELPIVVLGDHQVLEARAKSLNKSVRFHIYNPNEELVLQSGHLTVLSIPCPAPVVAGQLNPQNSSYVIDLLSVSAKKCSEGEFSAIVTAPVHKAVINQAGILFTGHTEFFADYFDAKQVVMMLACEKMRVALVTTHLPLRMVPDAITSSLIIKVISQLNESLIKDFGIANPYIKVAGLNPHAGESGYLGREEIDVIIPALDNLRQAGINIEGPLPADTMFVHNEKAHCDAFVAMYHDQGLPVLKYAGFSGSANITLGLPIIRTSVDHGTALDLVNTGLADVGSLLEAIEIANTMARNRMRS